MLNKIFFLVVLLSIFYCVNNDSSKTKSNKIVVDSKAQKDSLHENLIKEFTFEVPISKKCDLKDFTTYSTNFID